MPEHFWEFSREKPSPGVLLISQDLPVGRAVESLLLIWEASDPAEWENRLCLLPDLVTIAIGSARR
jgi:hypothetical protein